MRAKIGAGVCKGERGVRGVCRLWAGYVLGNVVAGRELLFDYLVSVFALGNWRILSIAWPLFGFAFDIPYLVLGQDN